MEEVTKFYEETMSRWEEEETKNPKHKEKDVKRVVTHVCEEEERQPWYKCVEKKVEPNTKTLGDGNWPYNLELEHLVEKREG
jgi:hypothetical protein